MKLAIENYAGLEPVSIESEMDLDSLYLSTPSRLAYALGWIAAAAVISSHYESSAIDVLPVFHPENGWDRFLITRRVSCSDHEEEPADQFGLISLSGDGAPSLVMPRSGGTIPFGDQLQQQPEQTVERLTGAIPDPGLSSADHSECVHTVAGMYPKLVNIVAKMIAEHPGLVVCREIYIDDRQIDGEFHPLYLHAVELPARVEGDRPPGPVATTTYNWFQFQYGDWFAFMSIDGRRAIYQADQTTWRRASSPPIDERDGPVGSQIAEWLRLSG